MLEPLGAGSPFLSLLVQACAGVALAACCGLRAFLPPLLLGLSARWGIPELLLGRPVLSPEFRWLSSTPALVILGCAVIVEVLADKVPALDHVLDAVQTFIRPVAGAFVVAASLAPLSPLQAGVAGLLVGTPLAGLFHVGKAKIRLLSTLGTGGLGSPVLSVAEDIATLLGSGFAIVASIAAVILIATGALVTVRLMRAFLRRVGRLRQDLRTD